MSDETHAPVEETDGEDWGPDYTWWEFVKATAPMAVFLIVLACLLGLLGALVPIVGWVLAGTIATFAVGVIIGDTVETRRRDRELLASVRAPDDETEEK